MMLHIFNLKIPLNAYKMPNKIRAIPIIRKLLPLLLAIMFFPLLQTSANGQNGNKPFESLQQRLIKDGFNRDMINKIYTSPKTVFETRGVSLFFIHREATLNYGQFSKRRSIKKASAYMQNHIDELLKAEKTYNVDKEIITAIILVETRLGTSLGGRSTLNTLSTIAALSDPAARHFLWYRIPASNRYSKKKFEAKALVKSKWAYNELKAFLKYTSLESINPIKIYGSYAGAIGISQFMPSNILKLGIDGNKDGRINLFNHADAIASIANYLKHFGWKPGLDRKTKYSILLRYNYSKYYANTILEIAERLKG